MVWTVGVRQLRERLSELLERVDGGDVVRVTSRGRPKALIVPPSAEGLLLHPALGLDPLVVARIEKGVEEGWIRPRRREGDPEIRKRGFKGMTTIAEALGEDREE